MTEKATSPSRVDRRKERTRDALLSAARRFLADGRTNVSIQDITDAADVGFGSFYNHFESKEALFLAAVESTLEAWTVMRDEAVAGYDDPAEIFAVSFRMVGRLQRQSPELARALLNSGMGVLTLDKGLAPQARRDIAAAIAAGRFDVAGPDIALMAAGGAMLGLLQWLETHPEADAATLSDEMAVLVLRMLGMTKQQAARLCARPLPPQTRP
jgi:AcrR family transcriptional regulator